MRRRLAQEAVGVGVEVGGAGTGRAGHGVDALRAGHRQAGWVRGRAEAGSGLIDMHAGRQAANSKCMRMRMCM